MAQVTLTSSVQQAGRQAACPGETVTFTCNVSDGVALRWIAGNQIPSRDPISFLPNTPPGDIVTRRDFTATLVSAITNRNNVQRARFHSQLTVTVGEDSGLNGTQVTCNGRSVQLIISSKLRCLSACIMYPYEQTVHKLTGATLCGLVLVRQMESVDCEFWRNEAKKQLHELSHPPTQENNQLFCLPHKA